MWKVQCLISGLFGSARCKTQQVTLRLPCIKASFSPLNVDLFTILQCKWIVGPSCGLFQEIYSLEIFLGNRCIPIKTASFEALGNWIWGFPFGRTIRSRQWMKQQLSEVSPAVSVCIHPPFPPGLLLAVMTGTRRRNHTLSRSTRANIEILIWISAVSFHKAVRDRVSADEYPAKNEIEFINPWKTDLWDMNDSCRVLLVTGGRSCESLEQSPLRLRALNPWSERKPNTGERGFLRE